MIENVEREIESIVSWMRNLVEGAGAKGIVLGLSGGIDSAVVAALGVRAFGENVLGIIMPCESIDKDEEDALSVARAINLKTIKVDLTETYRTLLKSSFNSENRMAKSNIKPRLRMTILYYYAQDLGYLVASGSNASEFHLGYFTKYGDSGTDMFPLIEFVKSEVYQLASALGIPEEVIEKKPSAGLWEGQSDELEMGFSYDELENHIRGNKIDSKIAEKIDRMHRNSSHKRKMPEMYRRI